MSEKQPKSSPQKLEYMKKYYQLHREKRIEYQKEFANTHKKQLREYRRNYRQQNKEQFREKDKEYAKTHKEHIRDYQRRYRKVKEHRAKAILANRRYKKKLKLEVFQHYSPNLVCQHCGFSDIRALTLDHVNGNGTEQKKEIGVVGGHALYCWAKKNGYPPIFQVLCMNCQWIKRHEQGEWAWKRVKIKEVVM